MDDKHEEIKKIKSCYTKDLPDHVLEELKVCIDTMSAYTDPLLLKYGPVVFLNAISVYFSAYLAYLISESELTSDEICHTVFDAMKYHVKELIERKNDRVSKI